MICYDVEFPELGRILAEEEIQILFIPFWTDTKNGYLRVRICAQARAIENEVDEDVLEEDVYVETNDDEESVSLSSEEEEEGGGESELRNRDLRLRYVNPVFQMQLFKYGIYVSET